MANSGHNLPHPDVPRPEATGVWTVSRWFVFDDRPAGQHTVSTTIARVLSAPAAPPAPAPPAATPARSRSTRPVPFPIPMSLLGQVGWDGITYIERYGQRRKLKMTERLLATLIRLLACGAEADATTLPPYCRLHYRPVELANRLGMTIETFRRHVQRLEMLGYVWRQPSTRCRHWMLTATQDPEDPGVRRVLMCERRAPQVQVVVEDYDDDPNDRRDEEEEHDDDERDYDAG